MIPRNWTTREELEKAEDIVLEGGMTGNSRTGRFFNKNPREARTYGNEIPKHTVVVHNYSDEHITLI